jgi:hypothetical protein
MALDPYGQPFNLRFNRARRAERDLSEMLGLAKGVLADGAISAQDAEALRVWASNHPDACEQWPVTIVKARLDRMFADGRVDDLERRDLHQLLTALVGGTVGIMAGHDAATELPLEQPPPALVWPPSVFVFTCKFAFGPRADCQRLAVARGGQCEQNIPQRTTYLIIGTFGSRDWVHTPFGRKIEKAARLAIVAEEHWARSLEAARSPE